MLARTGQAHAIKREAAADNRPRISQTFTTAPWRRANRARPRGAAFTGRRTARSLRKPRPLGAAPRLRDADMAQQLPQITRQRASKLQDFVAHASTVNSVFIGRKSGTLMATGGDDKKVNIWSIGKPNCVASITGHQSAVECVALDAHEQTVVAGSAGGTVKMWDLERHQVGRTLSGHRANCLSVQWHPYGEFFASGSVDTNLKIWDVRRKTCIQTYKGHTRGVRQVTLTPTLTLTLNLTLSSPPARPDRSRPTRGP